ncbi:MAG: TIGR02452 family protein [Lachnospiraceae bacterium]
MGNDNIAMLQETLEIMKKGYYVINGQKIILKMSEKQRKEAHVLLPDDIHKINNWEGSGKACSNNRNFYSCENSDSFALARKLYHNTENSVSDILVLNFANPVHPGGEVRRGARAQEEELCRNSSLLMSLESSSAKKYYDYNKSLHTYLGSDAMILSPYVEIIRDEAGKLLERPVVVAVLSCAAPNVNTPYGKYNMTEKQYRNMIYHRIEGILKCAAYSGYENLVLGAFGCGACGNDASVISDLFYRALKNFKYNGMTEKDYFRTVSFAVRDHSAKQYNFKQFFRNFNNFYRDEDEKIIQSIKKNIINTEKELDQIKGSLFGGAVGDALGFPVEFMNEKSIVKRYGQRGIQNYELDPKTGKALISDDTQMVLFTANGLLVRDTRGNSRGVCGLPRDYVARAYCDWLTTQYTSYEENERKQDDLCWLLDVPELYARRAPGITCLNALRQQSYSKKHVEDYIENPVNDSKGCGGVMRIAPIAFERYWEIKQLDLEGAQLAAITHGHPLGYMPAAVLTHILNRIVFPVEKRKKLKEIVLEARDTIAEIFYGEQHLKKLVYIINLAVELSENHDSDLENIHRLGEGWVAEETLGIALYCSLKYQNDFSKGVIAAVNHRGDSDSTGAVTGNILGAWLGYSRIEKKWKKDLELADVILEIATDICHRCHTYEIGPYYDEEWMEKYFYMHWKKKTEYVFFWHEYEKDGEFSNWYTTTFNVDGVRYHNVEQYIMAQKAKLFHDGKIYIQILNTKDPKSCKALGRKVHSFDPEIWDVHKIRIVMDGNRAKFAQNPDLMDKLLWTGNAILAEASPYDKIWGIGLSREEAIKMQADEWPGENLLGKVLMQLRKEFSN